jgi:hypothetical protein
MNEGQGTSRKRHTLSCLSLVPRYLSLVHPWLLTSLFYVCIKSKETKAIGP